MDVVLEVADSFIFDPLYAKLLPAYPTAFATNATLSSVREEPTAFARPHAAWQYEPATHLFSITPSKYAYMSQWMRDDWRRQLLSLYLITWIFGVLVYYIFASASYFFIFDKSTFNHPRYLKNQIKLEMKQANVAFPIMAILTVPFFLAEVRGYSKLYDTVEQGPGLWYNYLQFPFFLFFTDSLIYWIHRGLHHPRVYKHIHKPHHKWIMPTPYASHAFHPFDGWAQSLPYHIFPFLFPLSKFAYVLLFVTVNIWTVLIHDGEYAHNSAIINGAACHTMHHLYFNYNYGQFTTLWDRLGGSYRKPNDELFQKELKMCQSEWKKQAEAVDKMVQEVEGDVDDRNYASEEPKKVR
ncbi:Delta(7)-sterol 5(6)-desaturase [Curvularia clavata]|uniref:Delta(7)-sterol 5(6)-desaturase n=1 Tax=Curvularia clavata TaxID=95742 RepID=A0A9Q9DU84_CURCL|nr:Delta(7)-sterol 5(6)-desaturase [Curvularia clavata]